MESLLYDVLQVIGLYAYIVFLFMIWAFKEWYKKAYGWRLFFARFALFMIFLFGCLVLLLFYSPIVDFVGSQFFKIMVILHLWFWSLCVMVKESSEKSDKIYELKYKIHELEMKCK